MRLLLRYCIGLLGLLALAMGGLIMIGRRAEARTEWIAYISNQEAPYTIYRMAPDGTDSQPILQVGQRINSLQWSPNGAWLMYLRRGRAYRVHVTGVGHRPLTPDDWFTYEAAWSPDGHWIAYVTSENNIFTIRLQRPDSALPHTTIATYQNFDPFDLQWSHDAGWLAYIQYEFVMRVEPTGENNLRVTHTNENFASLAWSPDSKWLAYTSTAGGNSQLYRIAMTGGTEQRLTNNHNLVALWPQWSPDGQWIIFAGSSSNNESIERVNNPAERNLYRIPAHGGDPVALTDGLRVIRPLSFSPDGAWIVYISDNRILPTLYRTRIADGYTEALSQPRYHDDSPTWSSRIERPFSGWRLVGVGGVLCAISLILNVKWAVL